MWEGLAPTLRTEVGDNRPSVAYTVKIRSGCEGGGKGALVQEDLSATLATNNDQYLFQPVCGAFCPETGGNDSSRSVAFQEGLSPTLRAGFTPAAVYSVENHPNDSRVGINEDGIVQALTSRMGTGGGNVPMVLALDRASYQDKVGALCARDYKGVGSQYVDEDKLVCYSIDQGGGKSSVDVREDKAPTLTTTHDGAPAVCFAVDCRNGTEDAVNGALQSNSAHSLNGNNVVRTRYIVRRLTPLECERLQGYPDGWTDIGEWTDTNGKKRQTSDAARYKALGNSIALPPWKWVLKRLCACYERDATMGSLFDGISGFVLLWSQLNGLGSVKWTSEIEEFPIAVCKRHFGDEDTGEKGDFYEAILGRNKTEDV